MNRKLNVIDVIDVLSDLFMLRGVPIIAPRSWRRRFRMDRVSRAKTAYIEGRAHRRTATSRVVVPPPALDHDLGLTQCVDRRRVHAQVTRKSVSKVLDETHIRI